MLNVSQLLEFKHFFFPKCKKKVKKKQQKTTELIEAVFRYCFGISETLDLKAEKICVCVREY